MEIRKVNEIISIYDGDNEIETYEFNKEIDFSKLISHLIKKDFGSKIELTDKLENKNEQENNLVNFINRIIEDYNKKVDQFISVTNNK